METKVAWYWELTSRFNNKRRANIWLQMHAEYEIGISQQRKTLRTVPFWKTYISYHNKPATTNGSKIIWKNEKVYQKCRVNVQDVGKRHFKPM